MEIIKSKFNTPKPKEESLITKLNLEYNKKMFNISIFDIDNDSIKILAKENNDYINFGISLKFEELKNLHRYFRMFDTFKQAESHIIELCNNDSIKINEIKENEIIIILDLKTVNNDKIMISLNKIKSDEKEEIAFLRKCYNQQNKEIQELKSLIINLNKRITNLENKSENKYEYKPENKDENKKLNKILYSNIIKNNEELKFLLNSISPTNQLSLQLLYSSELNGENTENFKSAYLNKNDIIILVQTKKGKRFGGYAHEEFQNIEDFMKIDDNAFLFNLDKMKIYKSKGGTHSIWNFEGNSIDFGTGTDLRIYHDFFHQKNYTRQNNQDYNYDETNALNGEEYFEIEFLELYKVNFNVNNILY